jgi:uncharacterized membrane protein YfcA
VSSLAIVLVTAVMAASAALQGAVGFGLGLLAIPVLIYLDIRFVPGPLLVAAFALHLLVLRRDRGSVDASGLTLLLIGRVLGTMPAAMLLASLPPDSLKLLLAGVVLAGATMGALRSSPRPAPAALVAAGTASGFMATAAGLGGPPVALIYQHSPGPQLRGTLAAYFIVGTVVSLGALAWAGRFGEDEIRLSGFLIPGTVLGYFLSHPAAAYLDRGYTRTAVLVLSALAAVTVIVTVVL